MTRDGKLVEAWGAAVNRVHFGSGTFGDCRIYSARGGQDVGAAALMMVNCAETTGKTVLCSFNGTPMVAKPGDAPNAIVAQWAYWRHEEESR